MTRNSILAFTAAAVAVAGIVWLVGKRRDNKKRLEAARASGRVDVTE